jgi:transcriptional regulator with XRE-family HTH domain
MSTGELIRAARHAEGLTQAQLARRLGITQPSVARLEAAGDEVTVATLQRALNAMGRALELTVVARKSSVDETLLHETLRLTPDQRLQRFERWYEDMQALRHGMIEAERGRAA